jgi:hypothetical protein
MPKAKLDQDKPLALVLKGIGPRPALTGERGDKKNYAEKLSRGIAVLMARALRPVFPSVLPTEDELGHETAYGGESGKKRVDVAVWDDRLGLLIDVSVKTYSFRDWDDQKKKAGRFTKNVKRNDFELKAEADQLHRRQPYAILVGLMFLPFEACLDGKREHSSFVHHVMTFRDRTGRKGPDDARYDHFEAFYVAVYEYEGERAGAVRFFDVKDAPPKNGVPQKFLTLTEVVEAIRTLHVERNAPTREWGDADPTYGGTKPRDG